MSGRNGIESVNTRDDHEAPKELVEQMNQLERVTRASIPSVEDKYIFDLGKIAGGQVNPQDPFDEDDALGELNSRLTSDISITGGEIGKYSGHEAFILGAALAMFTRRKLGVTYFKERAEQQAR